MAVLQPFVPLGNSGPQKGMLPLEEWLMPHQDACQARQRANKISLKDQLCFHLPCLLCMLWTYLGEQVGPNYLTLYRSLEIKDGSGFGCLRHRSFDFVRPSSSTVFV